MGMKHWSVRQSIDYQIVTARNGFSIFTLVGSVNLHDEHQTPVLMRRERSVCVMTKGCAPNNGLCEASVTASTPGCGAPGYQLHRLGYQLHVEQKKKGAPGQGVAQTRPFYTTLVCLAFTG